MNHYLWLCDSLWMSLCVLSSPQDQVATLEDLNRLLQSQTSLAKLEVSEQSLLLLTTVTYTPLPVEESLREQDSV